MSTATRWNPDTYASNARFVADLGQPLLDLLRPNAGELIVDLGCGDGALTEKIISSGAAVLGADSSMAQARAARQRGLSVIVLDGHQLCFKPHLDAVFTNAALHCMKRPERVAQGVWRCLKPGGRFVGEFGGKGNVETIRSTLHGALRRRGIDPINVDPWYYPSPEEYSELLSNAGFTVDRIELIPRPTKLPGDLLEWLAIFAQPFTNAIADKQRETFLAEISEACRPRLRDLHGHWTLDYVRLRFAASKP